ncbi:helix-turn-helix domain-containing protein [Pseudonocardia spirodelae]|uniref:Helix-turn-helix domain-containing protein n=1 Tax=Pseudonocardia spirodelae TaxID=3133431 RepID=A0ABU8TAV3_9PSEU
MTGYRESAPPGPLRDVVEAAWCSTAGPVAHTQRVLPDGCMDLIALGGELVVAGPDTTAHLATATPGATTTGLRFRPGALPALLGLPADALRDRRVALAELLPPERRTALAGLGPPDPAAPRGELLRQVAQALRRAAAQGTGAAVAAPLPHPALHALARGMPAAELADRLGVTGRTLHRRCLATLGYGPAVARRVLRFRAASALLWDGVAPAAVAAATGYADQPHLSREVRALAGVSPGALAAPRPAGRTQANRSSGAPSGSRTVA